LCSRNVFNVLFAVYCYGVDLDQRSWIDERAHLYQRRCWVITTKELTVNNADCNPIVSINVDIHHVIGELDDVLQRATDRVQNDNHVVNNPNELGHDVAKLDDLAVGVQPNLTANPYRVTGDHGI